MNAKLKCALIVAAFLVFAVAGTPAAYAAPPKDACTLLKPIGNLTPVDRFNAAKMPLPVKGITKTPVSGLGDDAVYGGNNFRVALTVKKGNSAFEIMVSGFPVEESKAKEKALAKEVLAKL